MKRQNTNRASLLHWFRNYIRPFFLKTEPERLQEYDSSADMVEKADQAQETPITICLLGKAGVGKSTLINTLVAGKGIVVPSGGGTGPLTAQAIKVSHGETASFQV